MVTQKDLNKLFSRPDRTTNSVLTLYLNVSTGEYPQILQHMLDQQKTGISEPFDRLLRLTALQKVETFFTTYEPHGQSLIFIFDRADDFLWVRELQVSLRNIAHWGMRPYLRPLAEAFDNFPHYGVAVADKSRVRLFVVSLQEIEEHQKPCLKVVDAIQRTMRSQHISHLILAGPAETTTQLRDSIAKRFERIVIGTIYLPLTAESAEVLVRTLPIAEALKHKEESEIVRDLTVQSEKGSWAVTGPARTLDLLNQGRIWQLLYAEGLAGRALQCRQCGAIFTDDHAHCVYCGSPLEVVGNLLDCLHKHSIARGSRIRKLTVGAAAALSSTGNIGGFVKAERDAANQRRLEHPQQAMKKFRQMAKESATSDEAVIVGIRDAAQTVDSLAKERNFINATNIYDGFIGFEERSAALYLELSVRFFDNAELSWFWVEMAMEEKQHAGMLQHCREAGVFAAELPAKEQIQRLNRLLRKLEGRLAAPEVTLDDAFDMAIELESSEINDVYSRLTAPIEGPARVMRKKMELSLSCHFERLREAACKFKAAPAIQKRLATLSGAVNSTAPN